MEKHKMKKWITLALMAIAAQAGAITQTADCTKGCTIVSDPFPANLPAQPTSCKLYRNGTVVLTTATVDAVTYGVTYYSGAVAQPGQKACWFRVTLSAGQWIEDATAVYPTGDSGHSEPLVLTSKYIQITDPSIPGSLRVK
jgi:hypothetical protein